jgi:hypothetical protein
MVRINLHTELTLLQGLSTLNILNSNYLDIKILKIVPNSRKDGIEIIHLKP